MAEISTRSERSKTSQRPPLLTPQVTGAELRERLDLPRFTPQDQIKSKRAKKNGTPSEAARLPLIKLNKPGYIPQKSAQGGPGAQVKRNESGQVRIQPRPLTPGAESRPKPFQPQPSEPKETSPATGRRSGQVGHTPAALPPRGLPPVKNPSQDRPPVHDRPPDGEPLRVQKSQENPPASPKAPTQPPPARAPEPLPIKVPFQPQTGPAGLDALLAAHPDLPRQAAVFGMGEDGLPVLLDLNDPAPGPVLVISDERPQQIELLRLAVTSLTRRNTPRGAQFVVFSHLPGAWRSWMSEQGLERYNLAVAGVDEPEAQDWFDRLKRMVEQRRNGAGGPPVLVLMDTLNFLTRLTLEQRADFDWLIKEGAPVKIWPVAAISTALATSLARQVALFQTLIFGYSESLPFFEKFAKLSEDEARSLVKPGWFAVKVAMGDGEGWLKFHLP